jgi:hypothetical protein
VIGGALYEHVSYRSSFFVCAGFVAVDLLMRIFLVSDDELQRMHERAMQGGYRDNVADSTTTLLDPTASSSSSPTTLSSSLSSSEITPSSSSSSIQAYGSVDIAGTASSISQPLQSQPMQYVNLTILDLLSDKNVLIIFYCNLVVFLFFIGLEPVWALHLKASCLDLRSRLCSSSMFSVQLNYQVFCAFFDRRKALAARHRKSATYFWSSSFLTPSALACLATWLTCTAKFASSRWVWSPQRPPWCSCPRFMNPINCSISGILFVSSTLLLDFQTFRFLLWSSFSNDSFTQFCEFLIISTASSCFWLASSPRLR